MRRKNFFSQRIKIETWFFFFKKKISIKFSNFFFKEEFFQKKYFEIFCWPFFFPKIFWKLFLNLDITFWNQGSKLVQKFSFIIFYLSIQNFSPIKFEIYFLINSLCCREKHISSIFFFQIAKLNFTNSFDFWW